MVLGRDFKVTFDLLLPLDDQVEGKVTAHIISVSMFDDLGLWSLSKMNVYCSPGDGCNGHKHDCERCCGKNDGFCGEYTNMEPNKWINLRRESQKSDFFRLVGSKNTQNTIIQVSNKENGGGQVWTYRGTFGVTEVDLNGNAGPGYDKLKSFKFSGINTTYGASIFSLWLTSDGNGSKFQLIASMDAGYEKSDKMRYNYMLSNDVRAQTHLGDFPWYLNMQIDIRNDNLAIYYLNKKQHDLRIPPGKARVETNSYKAFVYVGSDGGIEHGRIRDINVVSNDPFVSNPVTCGNGSICVKQESEAQCCRNTCTSIGDIKSFCGAWVPKNLTSSSPLLCKGSVCNPGR